MFKKYTLCENWPTFMLKLNKEYRTNILYIVTLAKTTIILEEQRIVCEKFVCLRDANGRFW
ncbi:hypothetical protein DCCM_1008 [Desulfocucumis palustris]|uniref:Uncharacterized protein n=1 Tax=Desulfocucumis palustris TaxID=1898651 RepID=A0A2L2X9U1_9FIRM|nr:hypothetical protein DCCM_1008 [Desulfocucumis palustris]